MKKNNLSLKAALRLLKYSPQRKSTRIMCLLFIGLGIFSDVIFKGSFWTGILFISITPAIYVSMLPPLVTPAMAASSRKARDVFPKIYPLLYSLAELLGVAVVIATRFIWLALGTSPAKIAFSMVSLAAFNVIAAIYIPIFYKHPVLAYIFLFAAIGPISFFAGVHTGEAMADGTLELPLGLTLSLPLSFCLALLSCVLTALVMALIGHALRKAPVPDMVLKTYMK